MNRFSDALSDDAPRFYASDWLSTGSQSAPQIAQTCSQCPTCRRVPASYFMLLNATVFLATHGILPQRVPRQPPARPLREQATWWRGRRGSRRLQLRQHDTPVAHLDSSGAAELKSGRELAPRRLCDLHRKTAHNSAARGGLVMDQRGRRRFEGNRYGPLDATPCSSRRLV